MKFLLTHLLLACTFIMAGVSAQADHHLAGESEVINPLSTQINPCNINPGKTLADYERAVQGYITWSKKHDVEVVLVRQTPLFTHANPSNPGYDLVEFLYSDFETSGKAWNLWMNTDDGKAAAQAWQEAATCHVKMASLYMQYRAPEILTDKDRIVTHNWCSRNENVSADQLFAKHQQIAADYPEGVHNIAWGILYPQVGGADAPGDFAHVNAYPDMAAFMARQKWFAKDMGWRVIADYETAYANCQGDAAFVEQVVHRPGW